MPGLTSDEELYILDKVEFFPYGNDECLALNSDKNIKIKLGFLDTQNALACNQFMTLNEHIDSIFDKLSEYKQSKKEIEISLRKHIDEGLMITSKSYINLLLESESQSICIDNWKTSGWTIAICSADRPQLVSRLLSTVGQYLDQIEFKPLFLMIDDSRELDSSKQYKDSISSFCQKNGLEFEYWNRKSRHDFCVDLSINLPECEKSIHYLLSPQAHPVNENTIGQARGFAVLRSAGKNLLMLDDDTVLAPLEDRESAGSKISLGYLGKHAYVKSSYDELFISLLKSSKNPLLEHLEVLGNKINNNIEVQEKKYSDSELTKHVHTSSLINKSSESFIALSTNSIAGALNSRQMNWCYSQKGYNVLSVTQLLNSLDEDENPSIEQASWNGFKLDQIDRSIPFVGTTICGISALNFIPPLPPTGRNEDLALGALVTFTYKEAQIHQFGWGLPHLPSPARLWKPFDEQSSPEYNNSSYLITLLWDLENKCPHNESIDRIIYLSEYLKKMSESDVKLFIKDTLYQSHFHAISQIKNSRKNTHSTFKFQRGCDRMINYHFSQLSLIDDQLPKLQDDFFKFKSEYSLALSDWITIWGNAHSNFNRIEKVTGL